MTSFKPKPHFSISIQNQFRTSILRASPEKGTAPQTAVTAPFFSTETTLLSVIRNMWAFQGTFWGEKKEHPLCFLHEDSIGYWKMHGDAVQATVVGLLSMLIVLEAAWAGSVPCNATSIDVAAYDTEHSGTVVIEGCQWRQSAITLLFSQPATVVVQHVTLEGGTFTAVGSVTSGRFPSGSRLTIINSSATGCVDCFSVNADVLAGFSLVVVGSTLRGTHTAASIHSTNATDCTISIAHSSVSTAASSEDALSACVWGQNALVATRLQLSSEHSSVSSNTSAAVASTQRLLQRVRKEDTLMPPVEQLFL